MTNQGIIKFQLADIHFGVLSDRILEIVRLADYRRIPDPLPYVVGLTELRRYIVVIVDLRKRFGLSPIPLERGTTMIAMKISSGMIGLLVESISYFRPIPSEQILPPISIAGFPSKLLHGVIADNDDILILPNFDDIFSSYIHLHLLPITSSEKIAFQYRSTQGAITRTLENTLVSEGFLDETTLRKLPRAMELSSVHVHKVSSYYPHFRPCTNPASQEQSAARFQTIKAGDESYSSLSKRLHDQDDSSDVYGDHAPDPVPIRVKLGTAIESRSNEVVFNRLGKTLHLAESFVFSTLSGQPIVLRELLAHPGIGGNFAKTLRIAPVLLTKFLTYYEHKTLQTSLPVRGTPTAASPRNCLPLLPLEKQLKAFKQRRTPLEEALRTLNEAGAILNRRHIQWFITHYKVSLIQIAKLRLYFPDMTFNLNETPEKTLPKSPPSNDVQTELQADEQTQSCKIDRFFTTDIPLGKKTFSGSVSRGFQYLLAHNKLPDDHAVRYVAAQLRIPTCRLSAMRNYYTLSTSSVLSTSSTSSA